MNKQLFVPEHSVFSLPLWFAKLAILGLFLELFFLLNGHYSENIVALHTSHNLFLRITSP
jgi:hypothetical protein